MTTPDTPFKEFDSFEELFAQAEQRLDYHVEGAKNEFTEQIVARMEEFGLSKSELAEKMGVKRSFVTRLLSGNNNFTLETMVRIARSLDCSLRSHLEPKGFEARWVNVMKTEFAHGETCPKTANFADAQFDTFEIRSSPATRNEAVTA